MQNTFFRTVAAVAIAAGLGMVGSAMADDVKLPKKISWTAYGTTASGYAQSVAIGNAIKKAYGTTLRVIPGKNDVSRMAPLRDNRADFCACGIAAYFGQEGVLLFASNEWGPQPLRVVMTAIGTHNLALATAKDANIRSMADLKGKRISWVRAGDALNWNVAASLAFAGLTWDDVVKIEVSGFKASVDAIINGQSDAAFMSTITPHAKRLAASPRGLFWPELPHDDKAGWKRLAMAHPVDQMHVATSGANISKDKPHQGATYAYPALITNASKNSDVVYSMLKGVVSQFDKFKGAAPGAAGWSVKNQNMTWALPYHQGAVKYWKEIGIWSDKAQKHNDGLIKRQNLLIATWKALPGKKGMSKDDLRSKWMAARGMALKKAGLPLVFN